MLPQLLRTLILRQGLSLVFSCAGWLSLFTDHLVSPSLVLELQKNTMVSSWTGVSKNPVCIDTKVSRKVIVISSSLLK